VLLKPFPIRIKSIVQSLISGYHFRKDNHNTSSHWR